MNMKARKAFGDLKNNLGRTTLVIFALTIGLWGVGSLLVSKTILTRDLNRNFLGTVPPHAALISKDFNRLDLNAFRNRPEIESAEFRDLSLLRIEVHPDEWITLFLFGVEDFDHLSLARFYNQGGSKVPAPGTMLIERDGLLVSDLNIGSIARVQSGGKTLKVPVSGISFDPAQAPATQDHFIYAYVDKRTFADINGGSVNQRLIFRFKNVKSTVEVQAAVDRIAADLKSSGVAVQTVVVPKFNQHPHQWQLNTLLFMVGAIGLLAFVMGAVLVSQLMSAILAGQVRQIGILKAVGASRLKVFQIYLIMLLAFGVVASVVGIPLSVWTGYAFSRFVARILNFDILTTSLPVGIYFALAVAGLLLPVALSLPIVIKALNMSVLEAITDYGIRQDSRTDTKSESMRLPLPSLLVLAIRNTFRRKARLSITVLTMSLGVAIFSTAFNVRQSIKGLLDNYQDGLRYDVQIALRAPISRDQLVAPFRAIGNVERVEFWSGGRGALQSQIISTSDGIGIVSLPADTSLLKLNIVDGRMFRKSSEPEIVLNQQAWETMRHPKMGESVPLTINGRPLNAKIVGVSEEFEKAKIFMDEDAYDALVNPDHLANDLLLVAKDRGYDQVLALQKEVERTVAASNLDVLYVMTSAERVKIIFDHLKIVLATVLFLAVLVLIVSALGMTSATSINIMERTREIGVMRAVGATPRLIYRLFVAEGMIVGAASILLGLVLAWPMSVAASRLMGNVMLGEEAVLRYAFSVPGFWITLAATFSFGWIASRFPASAAIRVSTRQALMYE